MLVLSSTMELLTNGRTFWTTGDFNKPVFEAPVSGDFAIGVFGSVVLAVDIRWSSTVLFNTILIRSNFILLDIQHLRSISQED